MTDLSTVNLRFTCGTADEAPWRLAEAHADALFAHLRSTREFVRILMTLVRMGHSRAAAFLASALRVHGLARRWPHRGPFVVLAPSDEAFERARFNRVPGDGMSPSEARNIIEAHVAMLPASASVDEGQSIKTLSGRTVLLEDTKSAQRCGDNVIVPIGSLCVDLPQVRQLQPKPRKEPAHLGLAAD